MQKRIIFPQFFFPIAQNLFIWCSGRNLIQTNAIQNPPMARSAPGPSWGLHRRRPENRGSGEPRCHFQSPRAADRLGRRSPPSWSPTAVGRMPGGQAASGTRLFSAPARDKGGLGVTFPICGILPHSGHVGAQEERVSHGQPRFLPFIVKVSMKPPPGPWRAWLRPPELPAWPWPLVFSFHSQYLWGHLKGGNRSPMEFHPVSAEMAREQPAPLPGPPRGPRGIAAAPRTARGGLVPQDSTRGGKTWPQSSQKSSSSSV